MTNSFPEREIGTNGACCCGENPVGTKALRITS
jgi:hypothetical protein